MVIVGSLYLYSTNTLLAYRIAVTFFKSLFRVYAAEAFDVRNNWPSSNPKHFYEEFARIAETGDIMDPRYNIIVQGLRSAAEKKLDKDEIDDEQMAEIEEIFSRIPHQMHFFIPLIYIIDRKEVDRHGKAKLQQYEGKMKDKRVEYIIEDLKREEFEVISPAYGKPYPPIANP
jgi:hypothetical protein